MESLEDRYVLTTTLYLDFGAGIGFGLPLSTTAGNFRDINTAGIHGMGTGPDLTSGLQNNLQTTSSLDFRPLSYDFTLDSVVNAADITALKDAVLPLVQRALEPFDINVQDASASSMAAIVSSLAANNSSTTGSHDAYVLIADTRSNFFGGGSVGDSAGFLEEGDGVVTNGALYGLAAADDLTSQTGNNQDEAALAFSDVILASARTFTGVSTGANAVLNANLVLQR